MPEVGLELDPLEGSGLHRSLEHLVAGLAVELGPVHREVGVADERLGFAGPARTDRDADADADEQLVAVDGEWAVEGDLDPFGRRRSRRCSRP